MRDLRQELQENDGEYPPSWKFQQGEVIVGEILAYSQASTNYGPAWVCLIEEEERGKLAIWLTSTVLVDLFKKLKPKVGERIGLRCLGKHREKDYWRFVLKVDREEPQEPDFGAIQAWDRPLSEDEPPF